MLLYSNNCKQMYSNLKVMINRPGMDFKGKVGRGEKTPLYLFIHLFIYFFFFGGGGLEFRFSHELQCF